MGVGSGTFQSTLNLSKARSMRQYTFFDQELNSNTVVTKVQNGGRFGHLEISTVYGVRQFSVPGTELRLQHVYVS
jgi:hypothetical protein